MYHLHLSRNLRSLFFLLVVAAVAAGVTALWWANHTGLPASWRSWIERELAREGLHLRIGALSYLPLRGVEASDVRVFSDAQMTRQISTLERVLLDFDKTKLARGKLHLNRIQLRNAALSLPLDPERPDAGTLEVSNAFGTLLRPGGRRFEIREARGRIAGIDVVVNARFTGKDRAESPGETESDVGRRRKLLARIFEELDRWHFDPGTPPSMRLYLEADANDRSSMSARIMLDARGVEKNGHRLDRVKVEAEILGDLITLSGIQADDGRGRLDGRLDYDISDRAGRFDVTTTLEVAPLLSAWFGLPPPEHLVIGGGQTLDAEGGFVFAADWKPSVQLTGHAYAESVMLRGALFDSAESSFAWRDGSLFLRDIRLVRPDGIATAKALVQWPLVRMALRSTLPAAVYKPVFIGQPLEQVIDDFEVRDNATFDVRLEGGFDATDRHSWAYTGGGKVTNVNYRGVPVDSAECQFSLSHRELDFFAGTVVFNHGEYPLRRAFGGPRQTTAEVGRIRYVHEDKLVHVENVRGDFWSAPLVRLFAPKVADTLEVYRFHRPPAMTGAGVVDVTPQGRTRLDVTFRSESAADYEFLGENLTLAKPSGKVTVLGEEVRVRDLKLETFDGPVAAEFTYQGQGKLAGELSWTKLSIPGLASTYGYSTKAGGVMTGRIEFTLTGGRVETMDGEGLVAVEKTELFSVPIFGPLSPLISGILNDRRAGFERAKSAFCTFRIKDGVARTGDFQTSTTSLNFAGEAEVDLSRRTIDMTLRMNARGLLGLITLPLRPFYGMFQFRGTGPLKEPVWENVMFSPPPPEQKQLLEAPRALVVPVDE